MTTVAILFWAGVFLVFYTYLGYGILLWLLVKIREAVRPARRHDVPADPPEVTLLIAAYYNSRDYDAAYRAIRSMPSTDADIRAALQKITYFRALEA